MTLDLMFGFWGPVLLALVMFVIVFGLGVTVGDAIAHKRWNNLANELQKLNTDLIEDLRQVNTAYNQIYMEYDKLITQVYYLFENEVVTDEALGKLYSYVMPEGDDDDEYEYPN